MLTPIQALLANIVRTVFSHCWFAFSSSKQTAFFFMNFLMRPVCASTALKTEKDKASENENHSLLL